MKTNQANQHVSFILKDGHSRLAAWILPADQRPSLYESVEIPDRFRETLVGYEPRAVVTRIEMEKFNAIQIDLEAISLVKKEQRPVIILNSARIGDRRRGAIEAYLRSKLAFPLVYWESSTSSDPVIRFYDPATGAKACSADIQSGILGHLHRSAALMAA